MMSAENNRRLTEVGPGTPMGGLLRRYWHPFAASSEMSHRSVRPVRLFGEDLVLFKTVSGRFGLIGRSCTHRLADLAQGFVDGEGLRCNYHGWLFDAGGSCVMAPFEDIAAGGADRLRKRAANSAYPVEERGGLLWAYLGPEPRPLLPDWEPFSWPNGFKQIVFAEVPCNWFQCQENSIDPVHFEWLHDNWGATVLQGRLGPYAAPHLRLEFDEFDYGYVYRRIREGLDETSELWTVGRVCLWPNGLFTGDHIEWRVPIDDRNTLSVTWMYNRVPAEREPFEQDEIPAWTGPVRDNQTGEFHTTHILNQDFVAWIGQGAIADRTRENLGSSDRGITAVRHRFLRDLRAVEHGEDPFALVRDPEINHRIPLPVADRERLLRPPTPDEVRAERRYWAQRGIPGPYIYQEGQPPELTAAYNEVMGLGDDADGR